MGFLKRLFSRKKNTDINTDGPDFDGLDEEPELSRAGINFHIQEQRSRYVVSQLEQMKQAAGESDHLMGEYNKVTAQLMDMEEIEALPETRMEQIRVTASKLTGLEAEIAKFRGREQKMNDSEYYAMKKQEDEVEEGIRKIKDNEHYAGLVKKDLRRLAGERHAGEFRRDELENRMSNQKGMATIFLVSLAVCLFVLAVLQFAFGMEVFIGYFLATAACAIAVTVCSVNYMDADRDRLKVCREINKIIQLQNTVKIRYANNRRLLDYYYLKYNVKNGSQLASLWNQYQKEREQRRQFTEAEAKTEFFQNQLVDQLQACRVKDPGRWVGQVSALLDKREMVEIRHALLLRRQALREQMEYNRKLAENSKNEIEAVAKKYPAYAKEILEMMDSFSEE